MTAYECRCVALREAFNRVRTPEQIERGIDHTKIQRFDLDGNLVESINVSRETSRITHTP